MLSAQLYGGANWKHTLNFPYPRPDYQLEVEGCTTWENPDTPW
jgi:hypothetical protein